MIVELPKNPKILVRTKKSSKVFEGTPKDLKENDEVSFYESDWKCIIPTSQLTQNMYLSEWHIVNRVIDDDHIDISVHS